MLRRTFSSIRKNINSVPCSKKECRKDELYAESMQRVLFVLINRVPTSKKIVKYNISNSVYEQYRK